MVQVGQTRAGLPGQGLVTSGLGLRQSFKEESRSLLAPHSVGPARRILQSLVGFDDELPDVGGFHIR
jgi:hypothetical protein